MHASHLSTQHWFAPRNAASTPWYQPKGWLRLAAHHSTLGYKLLWTLTEEVHHRLPLAAADVTPPSEIELNDARSTIYAHQTKSNSDDAMRARAQALEVVARAACYSQGLRPSFSQLLAAFAMLHGYLIQLSPGEGKTLSIAIASVLLAWNERPLHVVTANDYLAARDAELMGSLYRFCGLQAVAITHETPPHSLASCYRQPIVYATAKQFLADFLRDDLAVEGARDPAARRLWRLTDAATSGRQPVSRGIFSVIIDEADGVLIDEATTPLIIASPEVDKANMLVAIKTARDLVGSLQLEEHYSLYTKSGNAVHFTASGKHEIEKLAQSFSAYWQVPSRREEIFSLAILAREVFQKDRHYVVQDGEVVIVDEGTGRSMPGRSWSHGVHQSIEAFLGLELTPLTKISARMTFQEFFRHYHHLCGASGTLHGLDWELWNTFGLHILRIPPRSKSRLRVLPKKCFLTRTDKLQGIVQQIEALHAMRLPLLVGTRRILDSEELAAVLQERGLICSVLNAKEHEREAEIVANAGQWNCITVSTNMAGRGTDIFIPPDVEAAGGLQVLMFEAHESPRIDWQLFGRSGRQGAQGTAQAYVSLEEELLIKYLPSWLKPLDAVLPSTHTRLKVHTLQWLSQRAARQIAAHQRRQLALMHGQLREQLGFSRA